MNYNRWINYLKKEICILLGSWICVLSHSVMSNALRPHGLYPTRFLCLRDSSKQEYWSGLPFPPLWDRPDPGIEPTPPVSPVLARGFFTTEPSWVLLLLKKKKLLTPRLHPRLLWRPEDPRSCHCWKQWPQIISDWGSSYRASILIGLHLTLLFYIVAIVL